MTTNLGKNLTTNLARLVEKAKESAGDSKLPLRHGAVLFTSKKSIHQISCNSHGHKACGYDVPSQHAEANCLKPLYNRVAREGRQGSFLQVGRITGRREKGKDRYATI